jgi:mRNA interferase MazF
MSTPKRGEVFLVNFDSTMGAEVQKTRPALILQNDIGNRYSPITIVAAITSKSGEKLYPAEVFIRANEGGLSQDSIILLNQIRSMDKKRLVQRVGKVKKETMEKINHGLKISLGLTDI